MPLALSAVISLSAASALNANRTATSTAIGSVSASTCGSESVKTSAMTDAGSPFPARSSIRRATVLIMSSPVSTPSANRNGPAAAFRRYRARMRIGQWYPVLREGVPGR
jgi:hypothetical protein